MEPIISTWRAAVVDVAQAIGVAVELEPSCDCAACLVAWWDDRTSWEADLAVLELAPVDLLPDEPGVLTRYVLGSCAPYSDNGEPVDLWTPDALPVHEGGAQRVHGHPALADLWPALELVVDGLDSLEGLGA